MVVKLTAALSRERDINGQRTDMIGTIDLRVSAQNPSVKLETVRGIVGSPSNIRLAGVPESVGKWRLTGVYFEVHCPDYLVEQVRCAKAGNVWLGTMGACSKTGTVENGFIVFADGVDEHGEEVKGYVLGLGDFVCVTTDGRTMPKRELTCFNIVETRPDRPNIGDSLWTADGSLDIFDGDDWRHFASRDYVDGQIGNVLEEGF